MTNSVSFQTFRDPPSHWNFHFDGQIETVVHFYCPKDSFALDTHSAHFGAVSEGEIELHCAEAVERVPAGHYFSTSLPTTIISRGRGFICSRPGQWVEKMVGGPVGSTGTLRYIDGCTDTPLLLPNRVGAPCLNFLHFPEKITQTPHTHPSARIGVVYRGSGVCVLSNDESPIALETGVFFVLDPDTVHSFNTKEDVMDIIIFHPDSDTVNKSDDDHPMLNRTIVDGKSARILDNIRTKKD